MQPGILDQGQFRRIRDDLNAFHSVRMRHYMLRRSKNELVNIDLP
jgi:hypothetical protein